MTMQKNSSEQKIKPILVVGGLGFIGSNLVKKLVSLGKTVIVVDNYLSGSDSNKIDSSNVKYIKGDAKHLPYLVFDECSHVYHLGEYSRVEQSFDEFNLVHENNTQGIRGVLEYCRKTKAKLIYSGSSTKFANKSLDGLDGFQQSPYAFTKYMNVELVKSFANWYGLDYAITYFYNVYGDGEISEGKYATLIAKFKKAYLSGEKFTVVLPGTQRRNFTSISDTIDGLLLVGELGSGDDYGIASDESYSIFEVTELFEKPNNIETVFARKGNRSGADIISTKTKALGWEAKTSLKQHIKDFIKGN